MKYYYENIGAVEILIAPTYLSVVIMFLYLMSKKTLLNDPFNLIYFISISFLYTTILLVDVVTNIIPFFPDTILYTDIITDYSFDISNQPSEIFYFKLFATFFSWISLGSPFLYLFFNFLVNQIGILLYWKSWTNFRGECSVNVIQQRIYLIISALYPLSVVYSLTPLRESYFLCAFGLFLVGLTSKKKFNISIFVGLMLIYFFRKEIFFLSFALFLINVIFVRNKKISLKSLGAIGIMTPLLFSIINLLSIKILNIPLSPIALSNFRNYQRIVYFESGMVYPVVDWNTWWSMFIDLPGLVIQFMVAPLPILVEIDYLNSTIYFLDAIFILFLIAIILSNIKLLWENVTWVSIMLLLLIPSSIFEYYITGAVRHRYFIFLMIIPLVAYALEKLVTRRIKNDGKLFLSSLN